MLFIFILIQRRYDTQIYDEYLLHEYTLPIFSFNIIQPHCEILGICVLSPPNQGLMVVDADFMSFQNVGRKKQFRGQ